MLAFKYFANNDVRKVEIERPRPAPGELLVKILATGVCGTDLHIYTHGDWIGKAPRAQVTMGHEFVGEVVEIGPEVEFAQKYPQISTAIRVGSRVCAEPHIPCGKCYWCLRGESNICGNIGHLGVSKDGSFAEYMVIPAERCSLVPDSISNLEAAGIEPLACAVRAVHRSRMRVGDTVVVIGAGPMGQDVAKVASLSGASLVVVSEPNPMRRKIASANGYRLVIDPTKTDLAKAVLELTNGIGADITFEVAGLSATIDQAIAVTRPGGRLVQVGVPTGSVTIDIRKVIISELEIIGEHATQWDFGTSIELIASKKVNVTSLITHTLPLEKALEGMHLAMNSQDAVKVVLTND
jgi:2-desacetyl-2-hydroxyethyl bacteriochlorophyllide A dehydrogenase